MANIKVSEMAQADNVDDIDLLMIVQNGTNKKTTKQTLLTDITTRLTETEEDIDNIEIDIDTAKEDIEQNQTNIEQLQQENQNLYNALATVSGTGANIVLNNTSKNKFKVLDVKGNTEQTQLTGKNLFNEDDIDLVYITNTVQRYGIIYTNLQGSYTISLKDKNGRGYVFYKTLINGEYGESQVINDNGSQITINQGTALIIYSTTREYLTTYKPQLEEGTTATSYEPYCGGIPSPNPEFPQQIKNVTGNVNVKTQNKNIFDGELELGYFNGGTGAKENATNLYRNKNIIKVKQSTSYTFSIDGVSQKYVLLEYDNNKNFIGQTQLTIGTFTTTSNTNYINFRCFTADFTADFATLKVQLEEGSTATDYVEHQEQNLPFTLDRSKNLYNNNALVTNYYINVSGDFVLGSNGDTFIETIIEGNLASRYVISFTERVDNAYVRFSFFNGDTFISRTLLATSNTNTTVPANTTKIYIHTDKKSTKYFTNLQIEEGSTATSYEPYFIQKLMLGDSLTDNGIKHKKKQVILNGSETWAKNIAITNTNAYICSDITDNMARGQVICSHFLQKSSYTEDIGIYSGTSINFLDSEISTVEDFKTWLSTHNLIVEYELAEEEITPYTETQATQYNNIKSAMSYYNQTNIYGTSTEASPIIDAEAIADMNSLLSGVVE